MENVRRQGGWEMSVAAGRPQLFLAKVVNLCPTMLCAGKMRLIEMA